MGGCWLRQGQSRKQRFSECDVAVAKSVRNHLQIHQGMDLVHGGSMSGPVWAWSLVRTAWKPHQRGNGGQVQAAQLRREVRR